MKPKLAKAANVLCVIGPQRFREQFVNVGVPYVVCDEAELRVLELGSFWRRQFPGTKTVCITGSVGQTTTTEMINHISLSSFKTLCIWVNKNLPFQAAWYEQALENDTDVYIQEATGAGVGLMEKMCEILLPNIFVITNVGTGHLGLHGGSRMSLLYEKTTADRRAPADALGVINYDDPLLRKVPFIHNVVWFSLHDAAADYHAENIVEDNGIISFDVVEKDGTHTSVTLNAFGQHNIYDALAAFAVGGFALVWIASRSPQRLRYTTPRECVKIWLKLPQGGYFWIATAQPKIPCAALSRLPEPSRSAREVNELLSWETCRIWQMTPRGFTAR